MTQLREEHGGCDHAVPDFTPTRHESAVRYMRRRHFVRSAVYKDIRWRTPLSGSDPDVACFVLRLYDVCAEYQCPVRLYAHDATIHLSEMSSEWLRRDVSPVPAFSGTEAHRRFVMIEHATLGTDLPPICWEVLHGFARRAADRARVRLEGRSDQDQFPHMIALEGSTGWDANLSARAEFRRLEREWIASFNRRDPLEN